MVVNSIKFWIFFICFCIPYFSILKNNARWQNIWLLIASYVFYAFADIKMLPLLVLCSIGFFLLGRAISKNIVSNPRKASVLTTLSVVLGVGLLVYFKYSNFFITQFSSLFESIGLHTNDSTFKIIMPVGLSFYTFKLISYTVEIHRGNLQPAQNIIDFSTFVAFFPTTLSGPIDRPNDFLPQLKNSRIFDYDKACEGFRRIVWGMFQKMCVADMICSYTDAVFSNYTHHNSTTIIIASVLYAFNMYADFCGYSNMAIGIAQILGLSVRENFNRPFFARNVAEYWRRWHMSLTTWITDYVYMPLNIKFRDLGMWGIYLATLLNLIIIGAWHGDNLTYVLFGVYHGLLLIIVTAFERRRKQFEKKHKLRSNRAYNFIRQVVTFCFCTLGFIIFRSDSLADCFGTISSLFGDFGKPFIEGAGLFSFGLLSIAILLFKEYKDEKKLNLHFLHSDKIAMRIVSMALLISYIVLTGELNGGTFIYIQY